MLVMGQFSLGFLGEKPPKQTFPPWRRGLPAGGLFSFSFFLNLKELLFNF